MSQSVAAINSPPNALDEALKGQMPEEHIARLIDFLRTLPPAAISSIVERSKIQITGDGNILGNDNVTIIIKGDNSARLASILRDAWKQSYTLRQLYAPVKDFVGRQAELEKLITALHNGDSVSICGMSGTGKTQLAMLVADRVREQYSDAQVLVALQGTLDCPRDPAEALEACIRAFVGPEETLPKNMDELQGRYYNLLRDKRALIVLDNAADSKQVRHFLPPPGCALVVTSISTMSLPGGTFRISLSEFQPLEARELLLKIVPRIDETVSDRICYLCGYMPLAIRAAGGFLYESGMDPANYAELLSDERTRLERIDPENIGDVSVEAAFNLSYRRLIPPADRVFCKLAVFQSSFDSAGEEYVCEDPKQWHLCSLEKRSLVLSAVIFDQTKRYRLQNLGRLFAERRLGTEERYVAARRHATHYELVLRAASKMYHDGAESLRQALNLFDKERDNIRTGQSWAESNCEQDEEAAKLCVHYAVNGECLFNLRVHPKERLNSLKSSLACARRLSWKKEECDQLGSIGRAYVELGDFQTAVKHYEQQLALARDLGDRTEEGHALNSLGNAYLRLDPDPSRAIQLYERALTISREVPDRQNEGRALNNLGDASRNCGDFRVAIDFYMQQLEIAHEVGDLRSEGNALNSLGEVYSNLGETRCAIEYLEKSLEVAQEIGTKLGKANVLNNLGNTCMALGEARRAIEFYEQAIAICREIGYSFGEHMTLSGLGEAYVEVGEPRRGRGYLEAALIFFRSNGSRRGAGNALNNLGKAYAELGEARRAIECHQEALHIAREVGARHGEAHVLNDTGEAYAALGEVSRATKLFEQAMTIFKDIGDLRGLCIALNNLGNASSDSGEIYHARELYEQAHANSRLVGDRRSESLALNNLGKAYVDLGEAERAIELLEQALIIARETSNPRSECNALFHMGLALDKIGNRARAITQVEAALRIYEQVEHPKANLVREQLAQWQTNSIP
jgi:tetratricopeptide (TPR) repeat protein